MSGVVSRGVSESRWLRPLAATVMRLSRVAVDEERVLDPTLSATLDLGGLSEDDRLAMALTSSALIEAGKPDVAAEIHDLLHHCTLPLEQWCGAAASDGAAQLQLVDADLLQPTPDCRELARGFTGIHADQEEQLFDSFMEALASLNLSKHAEADAYSRIREWVVRHPLVRFEDISAMLIEAGLVAIARLVSTDLYRPIAHDEAAGGLHVCSNCGMRLRPNAAGSGLHCPLWGCRMKAPQAQARPVSQGGGAGEQPHTFYEARRALQMYWIGPGLDEIDLYDHARQRGVDAVLYPDKDACDVLLSDDTAVDIKNYQSPFLLASSLNKSIGRLRNYRRRIIGIGDHLLIKNRDYLDQLIERLDTSAPVEVMTLRDIKAKVIR